MKGTLPGTTKSSNLFHSLGKKSLWEVSIGAELVLNIPLHKVIL